MIDVKAVADPLADFLVSFSGFTIGVSRLNLLGNELYLWAEVRGDVSRAELRAAKRELEKYSAFRLLANVDQRNLPAVRFAEFFGFVPRGLTGAILTMEKF